MNGKILRNKHKDPKVFLGGTCNGSKWRDELISMLNIRYFNPVVDDWDYSAYLNELRERATCDYVLYVITPRMSGVYSIAEVIDDSNKRPEKTILCILDEDTNPVCDITNAPDIPKTIHFTEGQMRSLRRVADMVVRNGGKYFTKLKNVANYLNK